MRLSPDKAATEPSTTAGLSRRVVLAGLVTAYTASLIPWALAESAPDVDRGNFLILSALIAGREGLDNELAIRYYDALLENDEGFPAAVSAILTLVNQHRIDPLKLQAFLDESRPELAAVPRRIATAWFLGVVESVDGARVLAYEEALNAQLVSDVLMPPSYCYGGYGSWAQEPGKGSVDG